MLSPVQMRICKKCKVTKEVWNFNRCASNWDKLDINCKDCHYKIMPESEAKKMSKNGMLKADSWWTNKKSGRKSERALYLD